MYTDDEAGRDYRRSKSGSTYYRREKNRLVAEPIKAKSRERIHILGAIWH